MSRKFFRFSCKLLSFKKLNKSLFTLWVVLLIAFFLDLAGIYILRSYDIFYRTQSVSNFNVLEYRFTQNIPNELYQLKANTPEKIMTNVMNFVDQKYSDVCTSYNLKDLYNHAYKGGGLNCNGMSELFVYVLHLCGFKARKIFVVKNLGMQEVTHTLVEVRQEGRWVIYDPTFNVSFSKNNQLLGVVEIAQALFCDNWQSIQPIFYGQVAYKARIETYPFYWLTHFNNILLFDPGTLLNNSFYKIILLPVRYWYGPVLYYYSLSGNANNYLLVLDKLYFFIIFILPVFILILFFFLMVCIFLPRKHK